MTQIFTTYPGIRRLVLILAYDNGMINRHEPEEDFLRKHEPVIQADGITDDDLRTLSNYAQTMSEDDAQTLAAGEHSEVLALVARMDEHAARVGPDRIGVGSALNGLLNDVFDHVPEEGS